MRIKKSASYVFLLLLYSLRLGGTSPTIRGFNRVSILANSVARLNSSTVWVRALYLLLVLFMTLKLTDFFKGPLVKKF